MSVEPRPCVIHGCQTIVKQYWNDRRVIRCGRCARLKRERLALIRALENMNNS